MDSNPPIEETQLHRGMGPFFRSGGSLEWTDAAGPHSLHVEERMIIGSSTGAGIVIQDPAVSRLHAELEPRNDGLWVRDLGSRNGTFLAGIQITGARLPQGARLRVGATEIRVQYRDEKQPVELWPEGRFGRLVGDSAPMRELFATLSRLAPMDAPVLIHGETGTGKELVAQSIHDASPRASKPFVVVDCAALPENLLDAELFGHARGAFTGAVGARPGAIEAAEGGTVFLDEIGELPISMQPKLLRVIESQTVRRVGETARRQVDVRFISATHRDLLTMVNAGEFREDLYFRLAVLPVSVPPLRARAGDVARLAEHFWTERGHGGALSPEFIAALANRPWRGNVRELRNFIDRARALGLEQALAMTGAVQPVHDAAPESVGRMPTSLPMPAPPATNVASPPEDIFLRTFKEFREAWIDEGERSYVRRLLERHDRSVAAASREAGVDRTYIYRLIRKHSL
jgi:two-component system, NtrC family, response regulator GlrR